MLRNEVETIRKLATHTIVAHVMLESIDIARVDDLGYS